MPTTLQQIILEAKRLARLQQKRKGARKALKDVEGEIKLVKRNMKALAATNLDPDDQLPQRWKGRVK